MNTSFPPLTVPWSQIQSYLIILKTHDSQIAKLISLKEEDLLEVDIVEAKITKVLIQMHDTIGKILKENNIILRESEHSNNKIDIIIREVLKLQNKFVSHKR
jgi:hypothetical protein